MALTDNRSVEISSGGDPNSRRPAVKWVVIKQDKDQRTHQHIEQITEGIEASTLPFCAFILVCVEVRQPTFGVARSNLLDLGCSAGEARLTRESDQKGAESQGFDWSYKLAAKRSGSKWV